MAIFNLFMAATAALVSFQSTSSELDQKDPNVKRWLEPLTALAAREHCSMFMDVDIESAPPRLPSLQVGVAGLRLIAGQMSRQLHDVKGIQVFVRDSDPTRLVLQRRLAILAWLRNLSPSDIDALANGRYTSAALDPKTREDVVGALAYDPETAGIYLERAEDIGMKLTAGVGVVFTNPVTGKRTSISLELPQKGTAVQQTGNSFGSASIAGSNGSITVPARTRQDMRSLAAAPLSPKGPLSFGAGRLLTLREIADEGHRVFQKLYVLDGRIAKSTYFVTGTYSEEAFNAALRDVTTIDPVAPLKANATDTQAQIRDLLSSTLKALLGAMPAGLTAEDLLNGRNMDAGELRSAFPEYGSYFDMKGLSSGVQVSLVPTLILSGNCGSAWQMGSPYRNADGSFTTSYRGTGTHVTIR